jgi:hypothetical protein
MPNETQFSKLEALTYGDPEAQAELRELHERLRKLDQSTKAMLGELARLAKLLAGFCVTVEQQCERPDLHPNRLVLQTAVTNVKNSMGLGNG